MEKQLLLESIQQCVDACETLATACSASRKEKIASDCLNEAIDCADGGMILMMKLSAENNELHRNLIKQFVTCCRACINACSRHDHNEYAHRALQKCHETMKACHTYVETHLHTSHYFYFPKTHPEYALSSGLRQVFSR